MMLLTRTALIRPSTQAIVIGVEPPPQSYKLVPVMQQSRCSDGGVTHTRDTLRLLKTNKQLPLLI